MNRFEFRLQKVMEWREKELEVEEARLKQRSLEVQELDRAYAALKSAEASAENELRGSTAIRGQDLAALAGYRRWAQAHARQLTAERAEASDRLAAQQQIMLEARRRCRLLERLRERRLAAWQAAENKEREEIAAESHLSRRAAMVSQGGRHRR